eukprot:351648-Chlamydomonas_euryale.AAC.1
MGGRSILVAGLCSAMTPTRALACLFRRVRLEAHPLISRLNTHKTHKPPLCVNAPEPRFPQEPPSPNLLPCPAGEAEHAAIGHNAVLAFVPEADVPLMRAAMADHDRDMATFYNHLADLLEA